MRILNVMFNKGMGGVEQVFLNTCHLFKTWKWNVFTLTHTSAHTNAELDKAVSSENQLRLSPIKFLNFVSKRNLQLFAQQNKIDLVLIHNGKQARFVCNALPDLPKIGYCHGTNPSNLSSCDAIITITETMHKQFASKGFPPEKLTYIPHVLEPGVSSTLSNRDYLPGGTLRLGYLGRLEESKGLDTLFKCLPHLKQQYPGFQLVMGGSGNSSYTQKLKRLAASSEIAESISWLGWIANKDNFFSQIDALIVPSLHESFGLIILEAFAHRVPVIASDADGPRSIITHGHDGFIFPRGNDSELLLCIEKLTADPTLFRQLCDNAIETLQTKFVRTTAEKKLRAFIESIV